MPGRRCQALRLPGRREGEVGSQAVGAWVRYGGYHTKEGRSGEMEQDQRICPRCGQPAGEYRFCASCRSQFTGPRAEVPSHPATHALREVLRLEEALAAASKGINERIAARSSTAAVQV